MIIHPNKEDMPHLKKMWKDIFHDSDYYINLVFDKKITSERSLIYLRDNRPISMIFFPQYDMKYFDNKLKAGYIYGAATLPEYRGMGIMGEMLKCSFLEMLNRGDDITVLIPANEELYDYYKKFGFAPVFFRKKTEYKKENIKNEPIKLYSAENPDDIINIYEDIISQKEIAVLQDIESYRTVILYYIDAGGELLVTERKDAFCFAFAKENEIFVKELFSQKEDKTSIISSLFLKYPNAERVTVEEFAENGNDSEKTGMAKILDFEKINSIKKEVLNYDDEAKACEKLFSAIGAKPYMNMMLD